MIRILRRWTADIFNALFEKFDHLPPYNDPPPPSVCPFATFGGVGGSGGLPHLTGGGG